MLLFLCPTPLYLEISPYFYVGQHYVWFFFVFWFVFGYAIQEFYLLAGRVAVFDTNLHWGMCLYALILENSF